METILVASLSMLLAMAVAPGAAAVPLDPENTLYMQLKDGRVVIRLRPDLAPKHVERVKTLAGEGERETERRGRLRARVSFEDVVGAVEEARGAEREEWLGRHGDWGKWVVLRLARRYTGMTLAALGREMGALTGRDMDYAAVSAGLRWFDCRKAPRKVTAVERRACSFLNL